MPVRYLILATHKFIVFIDDELDVDWKTIDKWNRPSDLDSVLNRAAAVESSEWENADKQTTIKFKRQIGEAIARGLDGNCQSAMAMLERAEKYRQKMLSIARRRQAIVDQVKLKNSWKRCFRGWTAVHYAVGIAAILLSTLVASKPTWLDQTQINVLAWLVAAFTGLLTFLAPDKKADKYIRAWSALNTEITRYNFNESHTVEDVLDACHYGENILHDTHVKESKSAD